MALNVTPVVAKIGFDADSGSFRMRASTQVKRPDGTHYEVEIETSVDLGDLIVLLLQLWSGTRYLGDDAHTAMAQPSPITLPENVGSWANAYTPPSGMDVGTADMADNLIDADLVEPEP
jgi:hypothetical protein